LSRDVSLELVSFERNQPTFDFENDLKRYGIKWVYYPYKATNIWSVLERAVLIFKHCRKSEIVHARGNFCGLIAALARKKFIWDCRALQGLQRQAVKEITLINQCEKIFWNLTERICCIRAQKIITITQEVIPYLSNRYNVSLNKFQYISTCVDLLDFKPIPYPNASSEIRFLLLGDMNSYYDLECFSTIVRELQKYRTIKVIWLSPNPNYKVAQSKNYQILEIDSSCSISDVIGYVHFGVSILKGELGMSRISIAPTKNAEFLATGRPIILDYEQGDLGKIADKERIGVSVANSKSIYQIANEILELVQDENVASRCVQFAQKKYDLKDAVDKLRRMYYEI
jgi:hypothetical protein